MRLSMENRTQTFQEQRLLFWREHGFYPRTILDIGAHRGIWSEEAHQIWPESKIWMFEANEQARQNLEQIKHLGGYEIVLLGEKNKSKVPYYMCTKDNNTGNSIYREQTWYFEECETVELPMTTLARVVKKHQLSEIDLIKIDTQGSELDIVRGGEPIIKQAEVVILEVPILEYNLGAPKITEIITVMAKLGHEVLDIVEMHYLPTQELFQLDLMFAKTTSKLFKRGSLYTI